MALPFIPRLAKVDGDAAPHINRSVEAEALPVFGGCFSAGLLPNCNPELVRWFRCSSPAETLPSPA